ncbi:MAG: helix-turn-helix domain-containing protein [Planctomycetota bacterium]|nr:XRE family transcriptional regulator [Planctomycetaceae bacterium]MDQ3332765.1 helix-turn-helix domain-containing protein [Planctomycetota bacterium]
MDPKKRAALEAAGYRFTTVQEFLGLSDAESELIELRVRAVTAIRELRRSRDVSQPQLAKLIGSSQPRVAKIEQGVGVSLDLLLKAYLALGGRLRDLVEPTGSKLAKTTGTRRPRRTPAGKSLAKRKPSAARTK